MADGALERGVAAGVPAGVEVGEAVYGLVVVGGVAQQVGDAEVHAATPAEHFLAQGAVVGIGIAACMLLGEGNADLHRPTGVHRVEGAEQLPAQGHHADKVIEDRTQLFLAAHSGQALGVGLAGGRLQIEGGRNQKARDMQAAGATVDFLAGDLAQAGHLGVGLEGGLLLGNGQHGTQVAVAGVQLLAGKSHLDICGPALAVFHCGGQ